MSTPLAAAPAPAPRTLPLALSTPLTSDLPPWGATGSGTLVCRQVRDETPDVRTFVFAPCQPAFFRFFPGQFLTFEFEIAGRLVSRCYSIASPPTRPHLISITVKRTPGGVVSNWLHEHLRPGHEVRAHGPSGSFTLLDHPAPKYLLLSAGSGVTPHMSIARTLHDLAADLDVLSLHSARTPEDVIFGDELQRIARELPAFTAHTICEADETGMWPGFLGRLSAAVLRATVPDLAEREVLSCGPPPYLAAVRALLTELGCDPDRYHEETFTLSEPAGGTATTSTGSGGGTPPTSNPSAGPAAGTVEEDTDATPRTGFSVEFSASGRSAHCAEDTTVLQAAESAGVPVPNSCRQGLCGTCKSRLISGQVDMAHAGGIREREVARGQVLLCCSTPRTDLIVDR